MECAAESIRRFRKEEKRRPSEARSAVEREGIRTWHPSSDDYSVAVALIEERIGKLRFLATKEVGAGLTEDEVKEFRAWLRRLEKMTWNSIVELYFLLNNVRQDLLRIKLVDTEIKLGFKKAEVGE